MTEKENSQVIQEVINKLQNLKPKNEYDSMVINIAILDLFKELK